MTTQTNQTNQTEQVAKNSLSAKQKMILVLCSLAAVVIIAVTSVLGTVAYLTSSAAVSNVFTIGNVGIVMTESKVDTNGVPVDGGATQVDTNTYHLVPNKTYTKDPHIVVADGSEDSFLFVLVRNDIQGIADPNKASIADQMAANGWAKYTKASTGWIYVYVGMDSEGNSLVAATDADKITVDTFEYTATPVSSGTYYLFREFSIAPEANTSTYGAAKITLTAVAIQDEGFNGDVAKAWEAVVATYPYIHTGSN